MTIVYLSVFCLFICLFLINSRNCLHSEICECMYTEHMRKQPVKIHSYISCLMNALFSYSISL